MVRQEFTLVNRLGLHARPASLLVETAQKFKSSIIGESANERGKNLKNIMDVLMLAVGFREKLIVVIKGPDENEALAALKDIIITKHFNED
jgi:phosphocarrier protein HPr